MNQTPRLVSKGYKLSQNSEQNEWDGEIVALLPPSNLITLNAQIGT